MNEAVMSNETQVQDDEFVGLEELLQSVKDDYPDDAPTTTVDTFNETEAASKYRRKRKGENSQPTPLQTRYQRQVRCESRTTNESLTESMSRLSAWTYMPGKDRTVCPPFVDLRDGRLMVMDRFPELPYGPANRIALSMYRGTLRGPTVHYGTPETIEMFKDFSIRPHYRAGGLCLDSQNEEVFKTALALDYAMELAAKGKVDTTNTFTPPPTLYGFPVHYVPMPEWRTPMQEAVKRQLHPSTPILRCLLSPGGIIEEIKDLDDDNFGLRRIDIRQNDTLHHCVVAKWLHMSPTLVKGAVTQEGQPLADLQREDYNSIREITQKYPFRALEWLERRIMDEVTEMVTVEEDIFDRDLQRRVPRTATWRCLPVRFVQTSTQVQRAIRCFLDFRPMLGRLKHSIDGVQETDIWTSDPHQVAISVMQFGDRPLVSNMIFGDGTETTAATWQANLMAAPEGAPWTKRCPYRGV